ncbi:MAG: hypothetical protein CMN25_12455 [Salinicola sp.]|uniref:hypothetical protein n=1 Tax=Salinicola sp. TaxID=1978524 RepID=UPI000C950021|nr:hypothetical protein [Salinicola sp.]MAM58137.1 hypothetical protein [Salinicola sp.]NRB54371.1 hypothetical protein [Salinicola sp.]
MEWLSEQSKAITAVTSILTLLVWFFYAQILYRNFARTRRPRIIINRGYGNDLTSLCLISNMSSEPIFLEHIIVTLHTSRGSLTKDMIDFEGGHYQDSKESPDSSQADAGEGRERMESSQGPMLCGSFSHVGTFETILQRLCRAHDLTLEHNRPTDDTVFHFLDIRVVAIYGSEDHPIGAERRFRLHMTGDEACTLVPVSIDTKRYANRLQRWRVRQWIRRLDG